MARRGPVVEAVLSARPVRHGPRPMSVGHVLLRHLFHLNGRNEDSVVAPFAASQDGIAAAVGISRAHASIELRRAMEKGFVDVLVRHVVPDPGHGPTRRKTYALTRRGQNALAVAEGGETCGHLLPLVESCGHVGAV